MKRIIITENQKINLFEGRESKHTNLAKKYWMSKHNCSQEDAMKVLGAIKHDIPNARLAQSKFLLGVTRLYDNGELRDGHSVMTINKLLHLIANDAHVNDYDSNLNDMSLNDLETRFQGLGRQEVDDRTSYLNGLEYTNNGYEVVRVPDFETAEEYGDYTSWCVTQDEDMYNNYTNNGLGLFYFFLKNGFENVEEVEGEGCPLDEYGLSMIAVSVNDDGTLNTVTCRWNHDNGGNDAIMSDEELSKVIGMNVYNVCKPYTDEELEAKGIITFKKVPELLAQGVDPQDIFNFCSSFIEGFGVVKLNEKWNFLKPDGTLLSPNKWFDDCYGFREGFAKVKLNGKWNYLKPDGKILSPNQWFDYCSAFSKGFGTVELNGKWYQVSQNGILCDYKTKEPIKQLNQSVTENRGNRKKIIITENQKNRLLREFNQGEFSLAALDSLDTKGMITYCNQTLGKSIGKGSSREVFEIGDDTVIKVAYNNEGKEQNKSECDVFDTLGTKYNLFPKIYQHADDYSWIEAERVLTFNPADCMAILGIPYQNLNKLMRQGVNGYYDTMNAYNQYQDYIPKSMDAYVERSLDLTHDGLNEDGIDVTFCKFLCWCMDKANGVYTYDERDEAFYDLIDNNPWCKEFYKYTQEISETDIFEDNLGLTMRNGKPWIVILDSGYEELK